MARLIDTSDLRFTEVSELFFSESLIPSEQTWLPVICIETLVSSEPPNLQAFILGIRASAVSPQFDFEPTPNL
jgi:hypothetical protein